MKWFLSYVQVYRNGQRFFGHHVYAGDEHPVALVQRWNATFGAKGHYVNVITSFQQVGDDCPEVDVASATITPE